MRGVSIDVTERQRAEEAAIDLSGRLITAQEEERARLARELHDDVTQRLALLAIEAGRGERKISSAAGGETLHNIHEGLVRLSEDVHALSYRLHPSILEDLGLVEALKTECERFRASSRCPSTSSRARCPRSSRTRSRYAFSGSRRRRSAMSAAMPASKVEVLIRPFDGGLQLSVKDDGDGFDPVRLRTEPPRPCEHAAAHLPARRRAAYRARPNEGTTVLASVLEGGTW